jgi:hypothetical protein
MDFIHMKKLAKRIGFSVLVLIFLWLGVRPMFVTGWATDHYQSYTRDNDGQIETMIFLPGSELIVLKQMHGKNGGVSMDYGLYVLRGAEGTNIVGPLWNIAKSLDSFVPKYIGEGGVPYLMEMEFKDSMGFQITTTSFPTKGEIFNQTFVFYPDRLEVLGLLSNDVYKKCDFDSQAIEELKNSILTQTSIPSR